MNAHRIALLAVLLLGMGVWSGDFLAYSVAQGAPATGALQDIRGLAETPTATASPSASTSPVATGTRTATGTPTSSGDRDRDREPKATGTPATGDRDRNKERDNKRAFDGEVTTKGSDSFSLKLRNGETVAFTVDAQTRYKQEGKGRRSLPSPM